MKCFVKSLVIFFASLSFCYASIGENFKQDFEDNLKTLQHLKTKIESLKEKDYEDYFGEANVSEDQFEKALFLFRFSEQYTRGLQVQTGLSSEDEENIRARSFLLYCKQLPLIKNLYNEKARLLRHSAYSTDLQQCIEAVNFYPKYFAKKHETASSFLKMEKHKTLGIRSAKAKLDWYAVYLHKYDWTFEQKKQALNITHRINQLDIEKISLPEGYKNALKRHLDSIKRSLSNLLKTNINLMFVHDKPIDIANSGELLIDFEQLGKNQNHLDSVQEFAYNPLNIEFSDAQTRYILSDEEREKSKYLLDQCLEMRAQIVLSKTLGLPHPIGVPKKKNTPSKRKKGKLTRPQPTRHNQTTLAKKPDAIISDLTPSPGMEASSSTETTKNDLDKLDIGEQKGELVRDPVLPTDTGASCSSHSLDHSFSESQHFSLPLQNIPSSSSDPVVVENDQRDSDEVFVKAWLADIIKETQSNDDNFGIFQKALRLSSLLTHHPELLEQTQEATTGLAIRLQRYKEKSSLKRLSHAVPEKLESSFLNFMTTPLCYLKNIRFGLVNNLLENLGVKIDKSMEGSRIGFSFTDKIGRYRTSIHLHDKDNGELDGGRISSLRKFLIDCGFIYNEIQPSAPQKLVRRGAR
ncbi:MAG: hypothetical protein K2P93_04675 [Alphaproteobacteria bacterium]|nr:hypothetical protein [Alphaproteobacteria bacterium]